MTAGPRWSLARRVARYLLFATVGFLAVDSLLAVVPSSPVRWLSFVVAGAFASLALVRVVAGRDLGEAVASPTNRGGVDRRVVLLGVLALLALGAVLRGYALGAGSLWFDEAITANAAIALLDVGRPTFPSGYTYWRAFPHTLAVAGSMALFGTGEAAARLPSVLFGVATIPATYWLGRQVDGRTTGLVAATLLTFLTWEVAWSRQARMYQLFQLLFVLSLVSLLRVERNGFGDRRGLAALGIVVVLAVATHQIGYVLLPVAVVFLGLAAALDGRLTRQAVGGLVVGSVALLVAFELAGPGTSAAVQYAARSEVNYLAAYADWLGSEFGTVAYLGLIGAVLVFYHGRYRAGALLVLSVAPAAWVLGTRVELFATRYLYFGTPVVLVWAATAIAYVARSVVTEAGHVPTRISSSEADEARLDTDGGSALARPVLPVALGIVVLTASGGGFTVVPQAEYDLGVNAPQPDFQSAYAYVDEHREPGDVIVAGWTAPGLYYAGTVDYWLAHDLTGTSGRYMVDGVERYSGAEPVRSAEGLAAVLAAHDRGWIVLDRIAYARQSEETREYIADNASMIQEVGGVIVFHWRSNATASV